MASNGAYGWQDRPYQGIPKAHSMTRAYWLAMQGCQGKRDQISISAAIGNAWERVNQEDFASTQPPALLAYKD